MVEIVITVILSVILAVLVYILLVLKSYKGKLEGGSGKEVIGLDDLPQNINKKREKMINSLVEIKSDTGKIVQGIEEVKTLIVESTKSILTELKKINVPVAVEGGAVLEEEPVFSLPQKDGMFRDEGYSRFYSDYIKPLTENLTEGQEKLLSVLIRVMKILDEKGDCPSVVSDIEGEKFKEKKIRGNATTSYDILRQVNLRDHTLDVAVQMYEYLEKEKRIPPSYVYFPYLIAAFAHDLGKIPEYQPEDYSKASHPYASAAVLREIYREEGVEGEIFEKIVYAVMKHHEAVQESGMLEFLKEADRRAREQEIARLSENILEKGFSGRFVLKKNISGAEFENPSQVARWFIDKIYNHINRTIGIKVNEQILRDVFVFHHNGYLYVDPYLIVYVFNYSEDIQVEGYNPDDIADQNYLKNALAKAFYSLGYGGSVNVDAGYYSSMFILTLMTGTRETEKKRHLLDIKADALELINRTAISLPDYENSFIVKAVRRAK